MTHSDSETKPKSKLLFPGLESFYAVAVPLAWPIVRFAVGWNLLVHGWGKIMRGPEAQAAPLTPQILKPIEQVAHEMWPGVPVITTLEPGATDAQFMNPVGIPTYGVDGIFTDPDGGFIHGLNERVRIESVYEGRTFLYRLVKIYAQQ